MTDEEFETFLQEANSELQDKQQALQVTHALGSYSRWSFEQDRATLQFFDEQGSLCLEAEVVFIGSYSPVSGTWLWAWANASIHPELRTKAEALQALEAVTGYALFGEADTFEVDEPMAWELTALAVKHLQAKGCYRAPSSDGSRQSFFALTRLSPVQ